MYVSGLNQFPVEMLQKKSGINSRLVSTAYLSKSVAPFFRQKILKIIH